jgi:hypothetical protein
MVSDRSVYVRVKGDVSDYIQAIMSGAAATRAFANELDTSTDRSTMLTQSLLAIAPAAVPIAAAATPALAGMTNQLAFAAAGVGVAALAFHGLGDALKAANEYALKPTEANLQKMHETMATLGPAGQEFVMFLQEARPRLQELQDAAQAGLFPGAQAGIEDLMSRLPQVERIISEVAKAGGDLLAEAGDNLDDPRWDDFFNFLETEARPTLMDFGRSLGNIAEGFANLWMAFDPLSDKFSDSFLEMSRDFAEWTDGLEDTEGFEEFLAYVERTGPQVWETLGALGNALLQVVEAAAPVGEVALPVIEAVADVLATVADSDAGPILIGAAAGISAISRAVSLYNAANGSALSGLLSGSMFGGGRTAFKEAAAATTELQIAQDRLAASAKSAQAAQFALIPSADKRRAIADYTTQSKALAEAEKQAGAATRARNAQVAQLAGGAGLLAFSLSDVDEKLGLANTGTLAMMGSLAGPWGAAVGAGIGLAKDFAASNNEVWEALDRASSAIGSSTVPIEDQFAALEDAGNKLDKFKQSTEGLDNLFSLKGLKNLGEDIFGKSDTDEATDAWMELADQYDESSAKANDLALSEAGLADGLSGTTDSTRDQVSAMLELIQTRNELAGEAVNALDAELRYEAAIKAATDAAKNGKDGVDSTTAAGQKNLSLLSDLAKAWNDLTPAQQNADGAAKRNRAAFIEAAEGMGMGRKEARRYADELLEIPTNVSTNVKVTGGPQAKSTIDGILASLRAIPGVTETTIRTIKETYSVPKGSVSDRKPSLALPPPPGGYTGMRIPRGYAVGGQPEEEEFSGRVPGAPPVDPTEDNVFAVTTLGNPLRVRSREWIINEKQSDKNDAWLRAINNGLVLDDIFSRAGVPGFASGGRYDDFSALTHSTRLDIERQKLRIKDIKESLHEKKTVGKGKKKRKVDVLTGQAKRVAELELKEAEAELAKMYRENKQLKNYGTQEQEEQLRDQAEQAEKDREKAEDDAAQRIADAATFYASTKKSAADRFSVMSGGSAASVDRNLTRTLANAQVFLGLLGDLKQKGASPWLLEQFVAEGPKPGAIRLARQYVTDQAAFDSIQYRAAQIDQYTTAYAGLVGSANFLNPAAWNSGVSSSSQTSIQITATDISQLSGEIGRVVRHEIKALTAGADV